jgi:preprotein translocase subunit SecA
MPISFIRKLISSAVTRSPSIMQEIADINSLEEKFVVLSDEQLKEKALELRAYAIALPEQEFDHHLVTHAFALVREAAKRVLGQRPYDVQLYGGLVLHKGKVAEMKTGEGKTLVAALPTFLNALKGKGVHVITVNDYLAKRDAAMIGKVHEFLGLSIGVILDGMPDHLRKRAYACDVTYVTNTQAGFDFLRDNLRFDHSQMVQRGHNYAIIDEIDSVLIDEARTPLVISGQLADQSETYRSIDSLIKLLKANIDYKVDLKTRTVVLTEEGQDKIEMLLRSNGFLPPEAHLFTRENSLIVHHVNAGLKANALFRRDRDYLVRKGEVVLIDEGTGRIMDGRRFNDGIHQAIEAKENVEIKNESQTLTSITYQNLFRLYTKLSGMSGTVKTEEEEFGHIYGLDVISIPTHRPVKRVDLTDEVHFNQNSKYAAIIRLINEANAKGQPILVGTPSVEKSERLAAFLRNAGYSDNENASKPFRLLNARNHEVEAEIVAQAGRPGAITVATNMAGRGTDIKLGGNEEAEIERLEASYAHMPEDYDLDQAKAEALAQIARDREAVINAGGLLVIGSERHDSRRVDNQLRGRSGRQGDPGQSQFFVALDDDVIQAFGSEKIQTLVSRLGLGEGDAISHPMISKLLDKAQMRVEGTHLEIRKDVVKYDDVINQQRKAMHEFRNEIMGSNDCAAVIDEMRHIVIEETVIKHVPENSYSDSWDIKGLEQELLDLTTIRFDMTDLVQRDGTDENTIIEKVTEKSDLVVEMLRGEFPDGMYELARKECLLMSVDKAWREHLQALEELRGAVALRTYAQREPVAEFRTDAYEMFKSMMDALREEVVRTTSRLRPPEAPVMINPETAINETILNHA